MMVDMSKRSYGTGSLFVRTDAAGRESWYRRLASSTEGRSCGVALGRCASIRRRSSASAWAFVMPVRSPARRLPPSFRLTSASPARHWPYADGRRWCPNADASGVDGPPRLQDDAIYADYAPSAHERELIERAFGAGGTIGDDTPDANTAARR